MRPTHAVRVQFYRSNILGGPNPPFHAAGKAQWIIQAASYSELQQKIRQLRKRLGIKRSYVTTSNDWHMFPNR